MCSQPGTTQPVGCLLIVAVLGKQQNGIGPCGDAVFDFGESLFDEDGSFLRLEIEPWEL